jgi:hypothetical protein
MEWQAIFPEELPHSAASRFDATLITPPRLLSRGSVDERSMFWMLFDVFLLGFVKLVQLSLEIR